jgi:hypothetical protein
MIPQAQTVLALLAMAIIGVLAGLLVFHAVPTENKELVTFALGALSGALTVGGASKLAERPPTTSNSPIPPQS